MNPKSPQPELAIVPPTIPGELPEPLAELSQDERAEWNQFVRRLPPDWFPPETWPMLAQLCRHICQARFFGQCLQEARAGILDMTDADAIDCIDRVTKLHNLEGRAITALMVRLRLTSQQRIPDADVADRTRAARAELPDDKPWAVHARAIAADRPH